MSSWTSSPLPLSSQVGGHPGILATEDGSLIIKKALPLELEFYQTNALDPAFEPLRPFLPKFYGTLKLEGEVDGPNTDPLVVKPLTGSPEVQTDEYPPFKCSAFNHLHYMIYLQFIVLENLAHPFSKPNILDIKLGTVLYDESATPEKRQRMENTARMTTSLETGIRLTGFQVSYSSIYI